MLTTDDPAPDAPATPAATNEAAATATEVPTVPASAADGPHAALQLAMRIGDVLLSAGMSANDAVLHVLRICSAYGLTGIHVDVTFTAMTASYYPGPGRAPITSVRVVRPTEVDYTRVRRLLRLVTQITRRGLPVAQAAVALEKIRSDRHPFPRWLGTLGSALLPPSVSLLFTTNWKILLVTFVTGLAMNVLLRWLDRWQLPPFFRNLVAASFVTLVAAGATYAGTRGVEFFVGLDPTLVVVGGSVLLLAGTMVVGAVQDAIDQFYLTASARMFEVFMRTTGIVAGIVVGLAVAQYFGISMTISAEQLPFGPTGAQYGAVAGIAIAFALSVYSDLVTILVACGLALVSWAAYTGGLRLNFAIIPANMLAALLAGVLATLVLRRTHVPIFGVLTAALIPLVPGLTIYRGLLQLVGTNPEVGNLSEGAATMALALGVAIGIGAGASLGTFLGRPLVETVRRITFFGRRRGVENGD